MEQNHSQMSRYMRRFFSGTLLSRVSGMFRDIGMAAAFGDHPSVAAFMVAFRFSHLLRRLLGEGTLQAIFTPYYQSFREKGEVEASAFYARMTLFLASLLVSIILFVEGGLGVSLFFSSHSEVLSLFAWLFPSLLFLGLYGLNLAVLQCHHVFFSSSIAPIACNVAWVLAVMWLAKTPVPQAMRYLTWFVLAGFMIQWMITLPKTWSFFRRGMKATGGPMLSVPAEVKRIGKASLWGVLGVASTQLNSFLDMLFASYANASGPVYLWYAIRLEQLPLAIVGFACVYSITPSLTRLIVAKKNSEAEELFAFGYRRILMLVVPCTFALWTLGFSSVQLLFGRGCFAWPATVETTWCLWAYALSLLPSTLVVYYSALFYAYEDVKTPMWISIGSVALNIALNALFVFAFHLGAVSIALSTSFCAVFNCLVMKRLFIKKHLLNLRYPSIWRFVHLAGMGVLAFVFSLWVDRSFLGEFFFSHEFVSRQLSFADQLTYFLCQLTNFVTVTFLGLWLTNRKTVLEIKDLLFAKELS
ncbi:MAG: murein biosynthesis integral membrane protein MurJ [Chlamydiae bacterium]|nr:murein biosynthesis integral membrane protein MurJ [Chlamydiota bacterium]